MSQYVDGNVKTFEAAGTIAKFARVVLGSGGTITEAGLAQKEIGTAQADAVSGDFVAVKLRTGAGTHKMVAAAALAAGATAFTAASGRVSVTAATAFQVGTALEASTAAGDVIEVLYNTHGDTAAV